ncbi:unnamed protein product [Camellia sinensis]
MLNGALLLLMTPVTLLRRLLTSELATIPVTTLPEGWVPPKMSCMKKDNGGFCGATAAPAEAAEVGPLGDVTAGVATGGATSATGGVTVLGTSASGAEMAIGATTGMGPFGRVVVGPAKGATPTTGVAPVGVAGIWPLGNMVAGPSTGATSGTSTGASAEIGNCGSTSSRIRAELAHPMVVTSNKKR